MRRTIPCLLAAVFGFGCASWDDTRANLVEPINSLIHSQYPRSIRDLDASAFVDLHADRARAANDAKQEFANWSAVANCYCIINSLDATSDDTMTADVLLRIDGTDTNGQMRTTLRDGQIVCAMQGDEWRIAEATYDAPQRLDIAGSRFIDESTARGLEFVQKSCGVEDRCGVVRSYLPGSGLALGDIDDDGDDDVILVGGRDVKLFVNDSGAFEDQSAARGIEQLATGEARYAVVADIDDDGDRDVFLGVLEGANLIYDNRGDGTFERIIADSRGITSTEESTGACFADVDNDGDLDLYVGNGANLLHMDPEPVYNARNGHANQLFVNDGTGNFTDRTESAGVGDTGWALAVTASDYDQDGDTDLFVANDFGQDRLFRNDGSGRFEEVSEDLGITFRGSSMGATFGDADGDGDLDLFVAGMASNSAWIVDQPGFPAPAPWPISWVFRGFVLDIVKEMFHGNRFYLNDGSGKFEEASLASGTAKSGWAWGGIFLDYDNDARLDLYVLNGLISGEVKDDL